MCECVNVCMCECMYVCVSVSKSQCSTVSVGPFGRASKHNEPRNIRAQFLYLSLTVDKHALQLSAAFR